MAGSQGGNRDAEDRLHDVGVARIWRDMPKIVFSKTCSEPAGTPRSPGNWSLGKSGSSRPARWDLVVGGADLAAAVRAHGLIDEYRIYVHPVLLGRGRPLFQPSDSTTRLHLAETRAFGNGVVLLRTSAPGFDRCEFGVVLPNTSLQRCWLL